MGTCPDCKEENIDSSSYCSSCGHSLERPKRSRAFRNFIITISILFSVILMGLIVSFLLNSGLKDIFKQQAATASYDREDPGTEEDRAAGGEDAVKVSPDQERILSVFGYPGQFMVLFDEGADNKRIDSWMYEDMETCFIFEEGVFVDSDDCNLEEAAPGRYSVDPLDFEYGMTPAEVEEFLGEQGRESLEEATGLKLLIFGGGEIICVFNDMDGLIGMSKNPLTEGI